MISEELRNELHAQLLIDQDRLQREIDTLRSGGIRADTFNDDDEQDVVDQHPADEGSELFEREKNLTVLGTLETSLQDVKDALARFDAGTYGICENCGKPIDERRLRAFPAARYDIECQAKLERQAELSAR
ncbi:MAG TPA: TraR/DksA C4-type zinc finger protein [Chloroflexota bacterium]